MPNQTKSKRIALSLNPELYDVISDLAELQNKPMSRIIVEMLEELHPVLSSVRDGLKEVKESNDPKAVVKKIGQDLVVTGAAQLGLISKEVQDL